MAMRELPAGWSVARLNELVDILDSRRIPLNQNERDKRIAGKSQDKLFPYFGATGQVGFIDDYLFDETLILLGEDGVSFFDPYKNKAYLAHGKYWVNNHAHVLRAKVDATNTAYLEKYLNSFDYTGFVTGSTRLKLTQEAMRSIPVTLAPLAEQKRIADKLDALLAKVDACRQRLDRVPALIKRFRQAVLAAATAGDLTADWRNKCEVEKTGADLLKLAREMHKLAAKRVEDIPMPVEDESIVDIPNSWTVASGAEVVEPKAEIVYGIVQPGPKLEEGVPYVRGMDIENGRILVDQLMKTSQAIAEKYSRSALLGGDVLLGIIRATKVAIVPSVLNGANITQGTARFRPSSVIKTRYLAIALEAPSTQYWLHEHYRGIDMPGLNLADVRRVPIPLPPLEEQREIVRRVEALFAFADRLEARYLAARKQVDKLTPSLLAKAFRGELVPQDPNDEPASALLERIRAERAGQGALFDGAPKRRRKTS
jgi:type I restriction enzyme S subunit